MKTKIVAAAIAAASLLGLSACSNMSRQDLGTVGGAAAGAVVGDAVIGGPLGVLGGAAAGGYIGNKATEPNRR